MSLMHTEVEVTDWVMKGNEKDALNGRMDVREDNEESVDFIFLRAPQSNQWYVF